MEYASIRDFIIAHYWLGERRDTAFWRHCREIDIPASLARKLDLFGSMGRVFKEGEELFDVESWIQVLIGQGLIPEGYDPGVDLVSERELFGYLENIEGVIAKCVEVMPDHAEYIEKVCKAGAAP